MQILKSRWLRILLSVVLIYFAFRQVDIIRLWQEIRMVKIEYVIAILLYIFGVMVIGSVRWCWLLIENPNWKDFWTFTKATYRGAFYGLFFPTAMAGDLLKWMPLKEAYPELSKTKIAGSVLIDRIIGLVSFAIMGLLALIVGKILKYQFPDYLFWLFLAINVGLITAWAIIYYVDFNRLLGKYSIMARPLVVINLIKDENKKQILKAFLLSLLAEPVWQAPFWFYSLIFRSGISFGQTMIFMPIISLILVLPISMAGFGARENLFLYFFGPFGYGSEKILLVSTFGGIMNVLTALIGGIFLLF